MKVVLTLGWDIRNSLGGTETFVHGLASKLTARGAEIVMAFPAPLPRCKESIYKGLRTIAYPVPRDFDRSEISGAKPYREMDAFRDWLVDERPDIYHQHSWTLGCGSWHLHAAKSLKIKTAVTVHMPDPFCMRGTMMLHGRSPCDGRIRESRCADCWISGKSAIPGIGSLVSCIPDTLSKKAASMPRLGRIGTVLAGKAHARARLMALRRMGEDADRVVVVNGWLRDALESNGICRERIVSCRHGVDSENTVRPKPVSGYKAGRLTLGYLGRLAPGKGLDVLVAAMRRIEAVHRPDLIIYGVEQTGTDREYMAGIRKKCGGEARIVFGGELAPDRRAQFFSRIDVLAVPSQVMETGPLVVLEALASRTPVIGSNLGGIVELIDDMGGGWLVAHDDISAWSSMIQRLATSPEEVLAAAERIGPVRTVAMVADETMYMYMQMLESAGR